VRFYKAECLIRMRLTRPRQFFFGSVRETLCVLAALVCMFATVTLRAQNARIQHQIAKLHQSPPAMGREFWFAIPSNFWGQDLGGKYMRIYITSPYNTTANIGLGKKTVASLPVKALSIATYDVPLSGWEMESSGEVQDNGVHVWSTNADLTVYFMSHNNQTSDGSYIIPTIGWGTDYVVAGFQALFEGSNDLPSEFTIVASTDNTNVTITPATDLRGSGPNTVVVYPQGQTFQVSLNRGQSVQFLSVLAQSADNYDVTGTIIHSSNPIGVLGGSMCTNIPIDFPYCDHVEDMMPAMRTWANTYYGTYFAQPVGQPGHDLGLYLFVSSQPNQTIWDYNTTQGVNQVCQIQSKYGTYWSELQNAQKFWSDAPFMLVEYINSSSYPDNKNGLGDPAEVVINPREQYTKTVVFETPVAKGSQQPYDNYATVIVNVNDEARTTVDGQPIAKYNSTKQSLDDTFDLYTVPPKQLSPGVHIITGDSAGVGVYIYGYGYDESYAWAGLLGTGTFHPTDTVSPAAIPNGACYDAYIELSDTGNLQTGLGKIEIDSITNMGFQLDTSWVEGLGIDTGGYGMSVADPSKPAYLHVSVYDIAGNLTTITSTYKPQYATIGPPVRDFGTVPKPGSATLYDTIRNVSDTPFNITKLALALGNQGFTLVNPDLSPIPPDSMRLVEIQFSPVIGQEAFDTIKFGDPCFILPVIVQGNAGAPDFYVTDQTWKDVPLQKDTGWVQKAVVVHNTSALTDVTVKFDNVSDPTHFYLAPYQASTVTVPKKASAAAPDGIDSVWFIYQPTVIEQDGAKGSWESPQVLQADGVTPVIKNDSLHGNPVTAQVTFTQDVNDVINCPSSGDVIHLSFVLANSGTASQVVNGIQASNVTQFSAPTAVHQNDSVWDVTKPDILAKAGGSDTIFVDFPVPTGINEVARDTLYAFDNEGNLLGKVIATMVVNELNMTFNPPSLDFGAVTYKTAPVKRSFTIKNPNATPVTYTNIVYGQQNGSSPSSFSVVPSSGNGLPVTLNQGDSLTVYVTFDPSVSFVDSQWIDMAFVGTACDTLYYSSAVILSTGVTAQSILAQPVLACGFATDTVVLKNTFALPDTVIDVKWMGPDSTTFMLPNLIGSSVAGNDSIKIPVQFMPDSGSKQVHVDSVQFILKNGQARVGTYSVVQNSADIATALVTSQFSTPSATSGSSLSLPINISINTNGLPIGDTDLDITSVKLVYVLSNPDLLSVDKPTNIASSLSGLPSGWSVDPASYVTAKGDSIVLILRGPKLSSNVQSLGNIKFDAMLTKSDTTTNVSLTSLQLFSNGVLTGCVVPLKKDSNFTLILVCGDDILRTYMQTGNVVSMIRPVSPNPVTGSSVVINYANRAPAIVTLGVYDVLGKAVARPVDAVAQAAGERTVTCDVSKLPNGTYTCRLSTVDAATGAENIVSKQFVIER